ncbi:MAG: hypothetical protein KF894_07165 [Labilithrix sp.]|nr:hypothetical protein [Labilithrix sp.]
MATKNEQDAATGKASFDRVRSTLSALPADAIAQPNVDLQRAAMAALVLVDRARHGERSARFALLPAALFAASTVDDLEHMANAALHVDVEALREGAATTNVKVDAAVMQQATELRDRMLKTAEYNLGHKDSVARELADIRIGTGYFDLANDCARLAALYAEHKSDLALDKRFYDTADVDLAASLASAIRGEYRAAATRAGQYTDLRPRVFTELVRLYNEVRAAAHFLFRAEPNVVDDFPALRAAALGTVTRRAKKPADTPATTATNGGTATPTDSPA